MIRPYQRIVIAVKLCNDPLFLSMDDGDFEEFLFSSSLDQLLNYQKHVVTLRDKVNKASKKYKRIHIPGARNSGQNLRITVYATFHPQEGELDDNATFIPVHGLEIYATFHLLCPGSEIYATFHLLCSGPEIYATFHLLCSGPEIYATFHSLLWWARNISLHYLFIVLG
ncbi:hypothetical protein BD770DRAFT_407432 [Pilaira anomala]|nr:hypothetical protein BD770DRAFT_407432 [Pilaira anomala]